MTTIKPRTASVVIYQGDDLARLHALDEAATNAEKALLLAERQAKDPAQPVDFSSTDTPAARKLAAAETFEDRKAERDAFAAEAEARGVTVALQQLGRKEWRRLRNAHPPREGNREDEQFDCNVDSLPDEAVPMSVDRENSTIEGDLEPFLDSLSSYDYYQRIFLTVLALNVGSAGADPKLRIGSAAESMSSATSN